MPRADFYLITKPRFRADPLLLVCELARKAFDSGSPALILARDVAQAEAIDDALWAFDPDAFIPHQISAGDSADDVDVPVLIATPELDLPGRSMVINLRDEAVTLACDRVLEVVPSDESAREPLRQRWKHYKARDFEVKAHQM